jgi:hypothetical protein
VESLLDGLGLMPSLGFALLKKFQLRKAAEQLLPY